MLVASIPTRHPYVAHLSSDDASSIRLPDPPPEGADGTDRWWPPRWLDPAWLAEHVDGIDVMHLHFGFDSMAPTRLSEVVEVLRAHDVPLVFTVHDLHNPHFADNTLHLEQLDILVRAADELITLTAGAAAEIERRWGAVATVVPHPHVAPFEHLGAPREQREDFVIGVHAKSLRANLDPLAVLGTVVDVAADLPGARIRIDLDAQSGNDPRTAAAAAALAQYDAYSFVDVHVHDRFGDDELWGYLRSIDVSVLPYRFGTHSGWLEACYDVGTAVVAPDCGYFADQKPCHTFGFGIDRFDPDSLAAALRSARARRFDTRYATADSRKEERIDISRIHDAIYRRAIARRSEFVGGAR